MAPFPVEEAAFFFLVFFFAVTAPLDPAAEEFDWSVWTFEVVPGNEGFWGDFGEVKHLWNNLSTSPLFDSVEDDLDP